MARRPSLLRRLRFHWMEHALAYQILLILGATVLVGASVILAARFLAKSTDLSYEAEEVLSTEELDALELKPAERTFPQPAGTESYGVRRITNFSLEAHGGRDAMSAVKSILRNGVIEIFNDGSASDIIHVSILYRRPNLLRYVYTRPNAQITAAFDGSQGWQQIQVGNSLQPPTNLEGRMLALMRQDIETSGLISDTLSGYDTFTLIESEPIDGREVYALQRPTSGGIEVFYLDRLNFLLLRRVDRTQLTPEENAVIQLDYGRYRYVDGIAFPFEVKVSINGEMLNILRIDEIKLNVGALRILFEKPL